MTFSHALATNNYGPAKFIVDASAANGTHTTIAAALTSASSGDTIFIRPGTYTENITLKAGVDLTAYGCDAFDTTAHVIILGTCTMTTAGSVTLSGIQLKTNSAALLAVTGSAASLVTLIGCYLNCSNNTGITYSSSSGSSGINLVNCIGDLGTTGIAYFTHTASGFLQTLYCDLNNTGASTTASTISSGVLYSFYTSWDNPITSSSTGIIQFTYCQLNTSTNTTFLTHGSTASNCFANFCYLATGSASAVSISVNATLVMSLSSVKSTNTNAVTGAGTLLNGGISFTDTSSLINTTTQTARNFDVGGISFDGGTNVMSTYTTGTFTPTILGSGTAGTPVYTTQVGYYTQIGNLMNILVVASCSSISGSPTGTLNVAAFPQTIKNQASHVPVGAFNLNSAGYTWTSGYTALLLQGSLNTTQAQVIQNGSTKGSTGLTITNTTQTCNFNLSYQV